MAPAAQLQVGAIHEPHQKSRHCSKRTIYPDIRNPIVLAKTVLDKTMQPLTLGRVPPNLLVGKGATEFARENGLEIVPNENMVSKNAGHRFLRWQSDISRTRSTPDASLKPAQASKAPKQQQGPLTHASGSPRLSDHKTALSTGVWNEGQPDSPSPDLLHGESTRAPLAPPDPKFATQPTNTAYRAARNLMDTIRGSAGRSSQVENSQSDMHSEDTEPPPEAGTMSPMVSSGDRASHQADHRAAHSVSEGRESLNTPRTQSGSSVHQDEENRDPPASHSECRGIKRSFGEFRGVDHVTDTVGAIAIDAQGHIAAGSSSGGIGMKHSGRLGPAALVRVGSAVIPEHPNDPDKVSVAVVTSGTGEHMATTMASQKCAERLLRNTRQGPMGEDIEEPSDHDAVKAFVTDDFMGHPGVKSMPSTAAIGVLAVKKHKERYYVYFAHNTESFALASMACNDKEPMCLMSRMGNNPDKCSVGARRITLT